MPNSSQKLLCKKKRSDKVQAAIYILKHCEMLPLKKGISLLLILLQLLLTYKSSGIRGPKDEAHLPC